MISLATEPRHRGRAFGVHRAMDTTGALLGPLVAFAVLRATVDGYDAVFAVSGCVAVLGVLVLVLFVPRHIVPAGAVQPPEPARPVLRDALGLLRRPELRGITMCATLLGLTTVSDSFLYLLLQREGALPAHLFPLLPLGTAAVFLLLALPLGALADRVGSRRLFLAGHGVLLLGYVLVLSPGTARLPWSPSSSCTAPSTPPPTGSSRPPPPASYRTVSKEPVRHWSAPARHWPASPARSPSARPGACGAGAPPSPSPPSHWP